MQYDLDTLTPENMEAVITHVANARAPERYIDLFALWLRERVLAGLEEGERELGTSALAAEVNLAAGTDLDLSTVTRALTMARTSDLLAGCWDYHPTRRFVGRPVIVWTMPGGSRPKPVKPGPVVKALPPLPQD